MNKFLGMSADAWTDQSYKGQGPLTSADRLRVLECSSGRVTESFFGEVRLLMHSSEEWEVVPSCDRSLRLQSIAFSKLSRGAGSVEARVASPHRRYPFRLFLLLCDDAELRQAVVDEMIDPGKACLLDAFSLEHKSRFPSAAELLSDDSLAELQCLALLARTDIAHIEARHATLRRQSLRGVQTWLPEFQHCSSNFFLLRQRLSGGALALGPSIEDLCRPTDSRIEVAAHVVFVLQSGCDLLASGRKPMLGLHGV